MRGLSMILVPLTLLAAACASAPSPTAAPPKAAATTAPAKPAEGKPAEAKPAPSPAAKAEAKPTDEWDHLVAAARQERIVNVIIPPGADVPLAIVEPFKQKFGLEVEFWNPSSGSLTPPRVETERNAGQYLWDVYVQGGTEIWQSYLAMGAFDPIEPALILPEVRDAKNWRGGGIEYLDPEKRAIVMTPFLRGCLFVNPTLARPEEFRSYRDLLDPKWKGKMILDDPRRPGPGRATVTMFFLHPELGPDFIRALAAQELLLLREYQQEIDLVAQGRYPILIGTADAIVEGRIKQGVPIAIVPSAQLRELCDVSPANGDLALFNRAPHPNAAKVYVNWILSKEGQEKFVAATGYVSNRVDVPAEPHARSWRVPVTGAIKSYTKEAVIDAQAQLNPLLQEVFGQ